MVKEKKSTKFVTLTFILVSLIVGIVIGGLAHMQTTESVPCWDEVCENKQFEKLDGMTTLTYEYLHHGELVYTVTLDLTEANILPISTYKKIFEPTTRQTFEQERIFGEVKYVSYMVYDSDGSELWSFKLGELPEWYEG